MSVYTKDIQASAILVNNKKEVTEGYGYKHIPIFAASGLHEKCFSLFQELNLAKDSRILVLGAGAGAFDQRLIDHGYSNITAVEFAKGKYKANNSNVYDYDLNEEFNEKFGDQKFDLVVAMEIIEHLYSPFDFLRKIKNILNPNGYVLLSTPNTENSISRIKFLLARKLHFFTSLDLSGSGHISPIFDHILRYYIDTLKYTVETKTSNGHSFKFLSPSLKLAFIVFYPLTRLHCDDGHINIYLLKS